MPTEKSLTKLRIAQVLLIILAVLAALAGVGAFSAVTAANDTVIVVEIWRMIGFFTFAALFSVLASKPQGNRSLWIIVIANKLALTIAGLILLERSNVNGATDLLIFDGFITVILVIASILADAWRGLRGVSISQK